MGVRNSIQLDDKVWGVVPLHRNGCHAEFVAVNSDYVHLTMKAKHTTFLIEFFAT